MPIDVEKFIEAMDFGGPKGSRDVHGVVGLNGEGIDYASKAAFARRFWIDREFRRV